MKANSRRMASGSTVAADFVREGLALLAADLKIQTNGAVLKAAFVKLLWAKTKANAACT
jgi:Flp pilus assembly protein TadG